MMNEPDVHEDFYLDAVLIVAARTEEDALRLVAAREPAWRVEELRRLRPKVFAGDAPAVVFADVRGD